MLKSFLIIHQAFGSDAPERLAALISYVQPYPYDLIEFQLRPSPKQWHQAINYRGDKALTSVRRLGRLTMEERVEFLFGLTVHGNVHTLEEGILCARTIRAIYDSSLQSTRAKGAGRPKAILPCSIEELQAMVREHGYRGTERLLRHKISRETLRRLMAFHAKVV